MLRQLCHTSFTLLKFGNIENSRVTMIPVTLQYIRKTLYSVSHHWLAPLIIFKEWLKIIVSSSMS